MDNPSAFPVPNDANVNGQEGMTLRDWFAGQCLGGVMTQATGMGSLSAADRAATWAQCAKLVYEMADAMLAARTGSVA